MTDGACVCVVCGARRECVRVGEGDCSGLTETLGSSGRDAVVVDVVLCVVIIPPIYIDRPPSRHSSNLYSEGYRKRVNIAGNT